MISSSSASYLDPLDLVPGDEGEGASIYSSISIFGPNADINRCFRDVLKLSNIEAL